MIWLQNDARVDLPDVGISRTGLERLHVVFRQFLRVDLSIKIIAIGGPPVFKIVGGEVLACGDDLLELLVLAAFKTADERSNIALEMVRVLSRCFLATAPSRISAVVRSAQIDQHVLRAQKPAHILTCRD